MELDFLSSVLSCNNLNEHKKLMELPRLIAAAMLATLIAVKAREYHLARHDALSQAQYYERRELATGIPAP